MSVYFLTAAQLKSEGFLGEESVRGGYGSTLKLTGELCLCLFCLYGNFLETIREFLSIFGLSNF